MRAHRGKQLDWSKPFKFVETKAEFQELQLQNNELVININSKTQPVPPPITKKEQIIVPKIQTVRRVTQPKKFAKIENNYIRLSENLNLPKLESYELNEVDHVFLQGHANKFKHNGKIVLTPDFLSKAFIELERKAGKDPTFPRTKNWMTNFVQRQYKQLTSMPNYDNFTQVFYNYWKNRRQQLKFPMLRQLWHPNSDEYNHLLAFKPRQKEKRNLRRNNRFPQDQIAIQMQEEFLLATKIAQRIKFREQLKLKQVQLQITNFHNECKQFFGLPNFFTQFDGQSRLKDRQKLKKFQIDSENVKKMQIEQQKENNQNENPVAIYDQKQSIVEFLSSVLSMAESFGINYDRIFNDKPLSNKQTPVVIGPPIQQPETQDEKCDYMSMKLYKDNNTVYRTFNNSMEDQSNQLNYMKQPKDIFQYKAKELKFYFYGSDDEGEAKDLRKNIATGFKKFQQQKVSSIDF